MLGVGGEVTEMDELLGAMAEAWEGIQRDKSAEKDEKRRKEVEKEKMGKEMVARSLVRKSKTGPDVESDVDTQGEEEGSLSKRRRLNGRLRGGMAGELSSFGQALKEADMLRVQVEQERLILERERLKVEQEECEKERELRCKEREARDKLELDKFNLMIEMFASKREKVCGCSLT
ncbi:hypothetical protein BWQ96_06888 [Gracilariopsis chorda]|uniref:Uncharacterized protein n=1 Tax=Gracilariopsis chorda TaxID=448386 RepID=A0A2V3IMU3_9FLOR|nr:hypothetical protein BWQ96_06888 [Gracilariopsis chorda]|eukprot:PXF43393.1 hypothetical protein BWQ96_06888 [Gracilariopsis chorda]